MGFLENLDPGAAQAVRKTVRQEEEHGNRRSEGANFVQELGAVERLAQFAGNDCCDLRLAGGEGCQSTRPIGRFANVEPSKPQANSDEQSNTLIRLDNKH